MYAYLMHTFVYIWGNTEERQVKVRNNYYTSEAVGILVFSNPEGSISENR